MASEKWRLLASECAKDHRVVVFEPPVFDATEPELELRRGDDVIVAIPHFEPDTTKDVVELAQRRMLDRVFEELSSQRPILWYQSADALGFTHHVAASAIVYDPDPETKSTDRDTLLRAHADVVLADEAEWSATLIERAITSRDEEAA
jgi:hypothetical protein